MAETYIDKLLRLQQKQKERDIKSIRHGQKDAMKKYGSMAGAGGISPAGSKFQGGWKDLISQGTHSMGSTLGQHDIASQKALMGAEEFAQNMAQRQHEFEKQLAQRELERQLQERLGQDQLALKKSELAQQQKQFESAQPKWYDYLLGGAKTGAEMASLFV